MGYKHSILVFSIMVSIISVQTQQISDTSSNRTIGLRSKRYLDFIPLSRIFVSNCDTLRHLRYSFLFVIKGNFVLLISFVRTLKTTFKMAQRSGVTPTVIVQTIQLKIVGECVEVMCTIL